MNRPHPAIRFAAATILAALFGIILWAALRPAKRPDSPRVRELTALGAASAERQREQRDRGFIQRLLAEDLEHRRFGFPLVMKAVSGCTVVPLDPEQAPHARVIEALEAALTAAADRFGADDSPAPGQDWDDGISELIQDQLRERLDAREGLRCDLPPGLADTRPWNGYPQLRLVDEASGAVFYLDPILVDPSAWDHSLRSFSFDPDTLKVTEDAVHLAIAIRHDGRADARTFGPWRVVDLSGLELRFKPEFEALLREQVPPGDQDPHSD